MEDKDGLIPWRVGFLKIPLYKKPMADDEERDPNVPIKKEATPLEAFTLKAREKLKFVLNEFEYFLVNLI